MPVRSLVVVLAVFVAGCGAARPAAAPPRPAPPPPEAPRAPRAVVIGTAAKDARVRTAVEATLVACRSRPCGVPVGRGVEVEGVRVERDTVVVRLSRDLGDAPIRPAAAAAFEREIARAASVAYPGAPVRVETRGDAVSALVPNAARARADRDDARVFAPPVEGPPLVRAPGPLPGAGLAGRHVALWPSHGWIYVPASGDWGWQRPRLFTTVEDLLTVGFVTRELAPMLERAGAVTLLPRERDPSPVSVVADDGGAGYAEAGPWRPGPAAFAPRASYGDGVDPFRLGTSRETAAPGARATWTLPVPAPGAYAVHVSYRAGADRDPAARYTLGHAGGATDVLVNQRIGGGTWVYLGTVEVEDLATVTLTAGRGGSVSADAVRLGGGTGVVARGGQTSGRPRYTEAARYYEQFAGAPASVYAPSGGDDDYTDDYRSRAEWANWLRGAPFGPTGDRHDPGLGVPVDLVLAWHTDAGIDRDGLIGTLAIYNVPGMDSTRVFPNGVSRLANRDLADGVQTQVVDDLRRRYATDWPRRPMWDRAYSEATRPAVPSMLLELLSHQNYRDMRHALDPRFRFDAARAVYKGIGQFLADQRRTPFVPQPLRPTHLVATIEPGAVALSWRPPTDPLAPEAAATGYRVEARDGAWGWAEAARTDATAVRLPLPPRGVVRSYRVVATNAGGEGRPSAALAVGIGALPPVLVVDGFDRVGPPDAVDRPGRVGFVDPVGVPEGLGVITVGAQTNFDPSDDYDTDARPGWGASTGELEGRPVLGNTRDHVAPHGRALLALGRSFASASDEAVEAGLVALADYPAVDLVLGLERRTPWPDESRPTEFEALPHALRAALSAYLDRGGALVVSGAHWATDALAAPASAAFLRARLGVEAATPVDAAAVRVGATDAPFPTTYGPGAVAIIGPDALAPAPSAEVLARYADGRPAAVAAGRTVSVGVPIESLTDPAAVAALLGAALARALGS